MRAGWPADSQQRPEGLSVQVHPPAPAAGSTQRISRTSSFANGRCNALGGVGAGRAWARVTGAWAPRRTVGGSMVSASSRALSARRRPWASWLARNHTWSPWRGRRSPRNAEICRKTSSPPVFGRMKPKPLSSYQRLIMPGFSISTSTRSLPVSRCILATRGGQTRRGSRRASCLFPGLTPRRRCSSRSGGIARSPGSAGRRRSDTRRKPRSCGCR